MIQTLTKLKVADNSGATLVECIKNKSPYANIGDPIVVTIQKRIITSTKKPLKQGGIYKAIVVRTKKGIIRPNGEKISFTDNAVVLYNNDNLLGTKIIGTVTKELRKYHQLKILSLASKII